MRIIVMTSLKDWIKKNEAFKSHPYLDTVGKLTIGWGRNIDDNGISKEEADFLFDNDFARCQRELAPFPWYVNAPQNVQYALMNMCFNLGIARLLGFRNMIMALTAKDYTKAAMEALDSKWANQVGDRAKQVALMMRQGF
jgi:lysozyme